uniref:Uncharacterized protein n=1 Tax=Neolamprologus brichardi TaxID=32507 RepID=A0A3Q4HF40_NEOBR
MASQVATPTSLQTTATSSSTSLSSPGLSPSSPAQLSPDDVELLAKLEEQNSHEAQSFVKILHPKLLTEASVEIRMCVSV